jgi:hypothetical protein
MEASTAYPPSAPSQEAQKRPVVVTILAFYSIALAVVTGIPQLYYVLFAINRQIFPIGPHVNLLGAVWYSYILGGQQGGYLRVDPGTLAGALEDAFMMGPLYFITGLGLLRLSSWVFPVGLITGAMIFYANLYFLLSGTVGAPQTTTDLVATVLSSIPYFVYSLWLIPTLLLRRSLFSRN